MAIGMNIGAFRDAFMAGMNRLETLERTQEGRIQLQREYRAEAKRLRETSGHDLWVQAGGEQNTHVAAPAELARRALERATDLDKQIWRLQKIKGIYEPYAEYMKR